MDIRKGAYYHSAATKQAIEVVQINEQRVIIIHRPLTYNEFNINKNYECLIIYSIYVYTDCVTYT